MDDEVLIRPQEPPGAASTGDISSFSTQRCSRYESEKLYMPPSVNRLCHVAGTIRACTYWRRSGIRSALEAASFTPRFSFGFTL